VQIHQPIQKESYQKCTLCTFLWPAFTLHTGMPCELAIPTLKHLYHSERLIDLFFIGSVALNKRKPLFENSISKECVCRGMYFI
jgi:hypothetical protein